MTKSVSETDTLCHGQLANLLAFEHVQALVE